MSEDVGVEASRRRFAEERADRALADDAYARLVRRHGEVVIEVARLNEEIARRPTDQRRDLKRRRSTMIVEQVSLQNELSRIRPFRAATVTTGTTSMILDVARRLRFAKDWQTPAAVEESRTALLAIIDRWIEKGGERGEAKQ